MDRKGFIKYMENRDFAPRTQEGCLMYVKLFFAWADREDLQVTKPDILKYLEHLKNRGLQKITRKRQLTALNHYFTFLYRDGRTAGNPCRFIKIRGTNKRTLYRIYTPEELDQLFDNYYQLFVRSYDDSRHRHERQKLFSALSKERNALILSILINQGTTTAEINRMQTDDMDPVRATLKIRGGKRLNDRTLPLKATQMGLLMHYLRETRPRFLEYCATDNGKLFLPLPVVGWKNTKNTGGEMTYTFERLASQTGQLDKQFLNFTQIRASVITSWLKIYGLRKAQYMAGHRNISTTEAFLPNNLDSLADDINKLHPF